MPQNARERLVRAGRLHWAHWLVIVLSFGLTLFAWRYSDAEHEKRTAQGFEQQSKQIVELIIDRMRKYEDALWAGTAVIHVFGDEISFHDWERYANSIQIESKYPGINGIGVIHALEADEVEAYLAEQRRDRPEYRIHPEHGGNEYYPISYIIPVANNGKAVGLDMAHETNRFTAAKKARDTGLAQITGPITLVQDALKTPGFLFYAPFYAGGPSGGVEDRTGNFLGMVYAPFLVSTLMEGVLSQERRLVGVKISDGAEILYDENKPDAPYFDDHPLFDDTFTLPMYGRDWTLNIRSTAAFRSTYGDSQPVQILIGGILIDFVLIGLFLLLRQTARDALRYADGMTAELEERTRDLEQLNEDLARSNQELDEFAHIASHDLKEPLRGIRNYATFLLEDYEDKLDDDGQSKLKTLTSLSDRLAGFIDDLLQFSRVGREDIEFIQVDVKELVAGIVETLMPWLESQGATVEISGDLPSVPCHAVYVGQVFRNLITNGVKYNECDEKRIVVGCEPNGAEGPVFYVRDNGIGIHEKHRDIVFRIFKRLHARDRFGGGTGAGLTVTKKIVERHGGRLWMDSVVGEGTTFYFTLGTEEGER